MTTKPIPGNWKTLQLDPVSVPLNVNPQGKKRFVPNVLLTIVLQANQEHDIATVRKPSAVERKAIAEGIARSMKDRRVTMGERLEFVQCGEWVLSPSMTEMSRNTSYMAEGSEFRMMIEAYVMRGPGDPEFMNDQQ